MISQERHRLLVLGLVAVAFAALANILLSANSARLGPGRVQRASSLDTKIGLAWALRDDGTVIDTVILGNSTADCGLDPDVMGDSSNGNVSSFNGALPGYDYEVHRPILRCVYDPLLAPRRLILGVSMMDANRNERGFRRNVENLISDPQWSLYLREAGGGVRESLFRHLALHRYGLTIQHSLRQALRAESRPNPRGVSRFGEIAEPARPLRGEALGHFDSYALGGRSLDSLTCLIEEAQSEGRLRLVVNMPLSPRLFAEVEGFGEHYAEYEAALRALAAATGSGYVDGHGALALPEEAFSDEYHMNDFGRQALSELVARELARLSGHAVASGVPRE